MPADFANVAVGAVLAQFMDRYPAISLELDLSPRRVDLVAEGFDVAIRMGTLPDDASLAARRITFSSWALYASPRYTNLRGLPEHPDDLYKHDLLSLPPRVNGLIRWNLTRGKTEWARDLPVRLLANSPELLVRMAATGIGIGSSTEAVARPYLQRGELVRVLPEWSFPQVTGWAVFPGRRLMPAKTRVFIDMLQAAFDSAAPSGV
jgi:DNA-binding transcriptional LysR family regulator